MHRAVCMRYSTLTVWSLQGFNNAQGNDAVLRNKYMHGNYPVPPTSSMSSPPLLCDHLWKPEPGVTLTRRTWTAVTC